MVDDPTEMALPPSRFSRFVVGGAVRGGAGARGLSTALIAGMSPWRARWTPGSRRAVDSGGPSRIGPWTTIGVVEESFHACSPSFVDLGITVAGREMHQSLGRDKGVVMSLRIRR